MKAVFIFVGIFFVFSAEAKPLFVLLGGALSCEGIEQSPPWTSLLAHTARLRKDLSIAGNLPSVPYVATCHRLAPHKIFIRTSTNPHKLDIGGTDLLSRVIAKSLKKEKATEVFIIGHSYGAYDGVSIIKDLPDGIVVNHLWTIDAISPIKCPPDRFKWTLARNLLHMPIHPGCVTTPPDVEAMGRESRSRILKWTNVFQTEARSLHSGSLASADESYCVPPCVRGIFKVKAHVQIADNSWLWHSIHEALR